MNNLKDFLKNFWERKGQLVFVSLFIAKICGFIASVIIIRILPESVFGKISLVASVFTLFSAFNGLGSNQSLLRFGAIEETDREQLAAYLFSKGFVYQLLISVLFVGSSVFFLNKYQDIFFVFVFFFIRLIGFYFLNHIQSYYRIIKDNRSFAYINIIVNVVGLVLTIGLSYFYGFLGYLISIAIAPFLALFWHKKNHFSPKVKKIKDSKTIWNYAIHAAFTVFFSDLLFSADVLLLGFLTNEIEVAQYKVAILIPANLTFLSLTLMQSDYPEIARNFRKKDFLRNYIINYYKIFLPLCIGIFGLMYFFRNFILQILFGEKYIQNTSLFVVLTGAFLLNMLLRNLYGNLLSAVGKINVNTYVSIFAVFFLVVASILLLPKFGVFGMGIIMFLVLQFTGILFMWNFFRYLEKLD